MRIQQKAENGYRIRISGESVGPYFLIPTTGMPVSSIFVNKRKLNAVPSREALYFTEGYLTGEGGLLIMKINPPTVYEITLQ